MQITVKTGGILGQYLPDGSEPNRATLTVPDGATPVAVMQILGMPEEDNYLVIRNGDLIVRNQRTQVQLREGDELSLLPPITGG